MVFDNMQKLWYCVIWTSEFECKFDYVTVLISFIAYKSKMTEEVPSTMIIYPKKGVYVPFIGLFIRFEGY